MSEPRNANACGYSKLAAAQCGFRWEAGVFTELNRQIKLECDLVYALSLKYHHKSLCGDFATFPRKVFKHIVVKLYVVNGKIRDYTKIAIKGDCLVRGWSILVALGVSSYECETLRLGGWVWLPASSCPQFLLTPCHVLSLPPSPLLDFSPCGSCLLRATLLAQQFLNGHISVWGERGSCAHPTLQSGHCDKVSSAPARTEGGLPDSGSCSVWEVQVRFAFSVLAKFFWGPGKGNQIHTKTPWSSWNCQVFCDLSCSILSQKALALCYLIRK